MPQKKPTPTQLLKRSPNYLKICFAYNYTIVLPYAEAMTLLNTFNLAESFDTKDYQNPKIIPLQQEAVPTIASLNQSEYLDFKMAAILGINPNNEEKKDEPF